MKRAFCGWCLFLLRVQQGWCFGFAGGPLSYTRRNTRTSIATLSPRRKPVGSSLFLKEAAPAKRALVLSSEEESSSNCTAAATVLKDKRTSPRLWLESQPLDGAYTVLRCDYHPQAEVCWKVWGRDFHWKRLRNSMEAFMQLQHQGGQNTTIKLKSAAYENAVEETERILNQLLKASAEFSGWGRDNGNSNKTTSGRDQQESSRSVFMTTILWTLPSTIPNKNDTIFRVQGHICHAWSNCNTADEFPFASYNPETLTVVVACDPNNDDPQSSSTSRLLPNRQPHPRAKLSAWCRQRRPLDERFRENMYEWLPNAMVDTSTKKIQASVAVDEVLLVKQGQAKTADFTEVGQSCLLEGLTSNLFVVYPNKVIRTANDGVLHGYARHLLLQAVATDTNDGWVVDTTTPILLEEANQWQQLFLTSAIRLVVPVGRVLIPVSGKGEGRCYLREVWIDPIKQDGNTSSQKTVPFQIWRRIYASIVQRRYHSSDETE